MDAFYVIIIHKTHPFLYHTFRIAIVSQFEINATEIILQCP